jgi:hypothetical protein
MYSHFISVLWKGKALLPSLQQTDFATELKPNEINLYPHTISTLADKTFNEKILFSDLSLTFVQEERVVSK